MVDIKSESRAKAQTSMKYLVYTLAIIAIMAGILKWSAIHDAQLMAAMDRYDACMRAEYGTTAAAWYAEHGSLPECE